uniref:Uncharacterized protein n=1 Tax=Oryza brachyantha TaxID=4533 RepID=J3LUF1_ORYBR
MPQLDKPAAAPASWSSGLFDCFDLCTYRCLTWWCPCVTFGRVAEMVDMGSTSCGDSAARYALLATVTGGCQWIYTYSYRGKMRGRPRRGARGDCCVHFCCERCALCQEYRELAARGYHPSLGWQLNMERRAAATAPPAVHYMAG